MTKKLDPGRPKTYRERLYASTKVVDPNKPKARMGRPPKARKNSLKLKALWADPATRPRMLANLAANRVKTQAERKANPDKYSRSGIPHGYTRATVAPLWAKARKQADRFIQMITDEGLVSAVVIPDSDEAKGVAALHEACVLALGPGEKQAKLAALRTVLEYTRSKPESKSKMTINTSEDFLAAIASEDAKNA